jgi:hypothetical protein
MIGLSTVNPSNSACPACRHSNILLNVSDTAESELLCSLYKEFSTWARVHCEKQVIYGEKKTHKKDVSPVIQPEVRMFLGLCHDEWLKLRAFWVGTRTTR